MEGRTSRDFSGLVSTYVAAKQLDVKVENLIEEMDGVLEREVMMEGAMGKFGEVVASLEEDFKNALTMIAELEKRMERMDLCMSKLEEDFNNSNK